LLGLGRQAGRKEERMSAFSYQQVARNLLEKSGKNLLVIAPTGAGKTRVGFEALKLAGRGCYIAPTRALCYEKYRRFLERFPESQVVLGNKDYGLGDKLFRGSDLRVLTPWKLNQFLTNCRNLGRHSPVVVVDEIHNLDPDVEIILTKLMLLHPDVRIVGLSATVHEHNEPKFAQWLKALVVKGEERPVPLVERLVHFEPDLDEEGQEVTNVTITENGSGLVDSWVIDHEISGYDHLWEIYQYIRATGDTAPILIWTPYRKRAERICNLFAGRFQSEGRQPDPELRAAADSLPSGSSDHTWSLKNALPWSVGMHHGGLSQRERELVYELAVAGKLEIIITCMTLAQGVNLPARHVVFESVYDFDETGQRRLIDVSTFRQIQGRAGRPQFDTIGYCWIPVFSEVERVEVEEVLLKYKASKIESRLYNEFFLTSQVPGLILLGFNTPVKLAEFIKATFWGQALQDIQPLVEQFEKIISYLLDHQVAEPWDGRLILTEKGQKVARLGLHPEEYETIEALVAKNCLDYDSWVRDLGRVQVGYGSDRYGEALDMVVDYGLTVYTISQATHRERDLADYVQRMLDITESFFAINRVDPGYRNEWREKVAHKFLYGNLVLVERLAPALARDQIKRLIRNLGQLLMKEPYWLSREDQLEIARCLYGHYRKFFPGKQSEAVATVLGIPHEEFIQIVEEARRKETQKGGEENGES
jgi:replicative superfamily II helicase